MRWAVAVRNSSSSPPRRVEESFSNGCWSSPNCLANNIPTAPERARWRVRGGGASPSAGGSDALVARREGGNGLMSRDLATGTLLSLGGDEASLLRRIAGYGNHTAR